MRIPLSWLAESVDLPVGVTADSVMAELVKIGLEEEGKHSFDLTGPIVVGQVLEFVEEEASNGKSIRWCQVRVAPAGEKAADGGADVRGIVCGAKNFVPGDKVVVTLPGAVAKRAGNHLGVAHMPDIPAGVAFAFSPSKSSLVVVKVKSFGLYG